MGGGGWRETMEVKGGVQLLQNKIQLVCCLIGLTNLTKKFDEKRLRKKAATIGSFNHALKSV